MTAPSSIDPARFLHEHLASASPDLLRQMLTTFINTLMSAEADAVCGAGYGETGSSGDVEKHSLASQCGYPRNRQGRRDYRAAPGDAQSK